MPFLAIGPLRCLKYSTCQDRHAQVMAAFALKLWQLCLVQVQVKSLVLIAELGKPSVLNPHEWRFAISAAQHCDAGSYIRRAAP